MITLRLSNKASYTLMGLFFVLATAFLVYSYTQPIPNPGHGADVVLISVNGTEMTLQQALDQGRLAGGSASQFKLSKEFYFGCGIHNITGQWDACFLVNVWHDDNGDDSDFRKWVYNINNSDPVNSKRWERKQGQRRPLLQNLAFIFLSAMPFTRDATFSAMIASFTNASIF
jgi:hypothetical protein